MRSLNFYAIALGMLLTIPAIGQSLRIETIHGAPWGFIGRDGKITGMMYEIGNLIAKEAGFDYINSLAPYARTAFDIENGTADIVLRFGNEQMDRGALPVAIIVSMPIIVLGPKGSHFESLRELRGKVVGLIRSSKYVEQFDSSNDIHKYPVNDYEQMAKMLSLRRFDAGIGSSAGLYYGAYVAGIRPEQLGEPLVLGSNDFILFFSKRTANQETIKALKETVRKLIASGEIQKIVEKYTSKLSIKLPQK